MPWYKQSVLLFAGAILLLLFSCAARATQSSPVLQTSVPAPTTASVPQTPLPAPTSAPAQAALSAPYPNSTDGLRTFLNDLLTAIKSGDGKTVDELIKQTEFPDYGQWFQHTYSPDPETADDWAVAYRDNVSRNEGLFRELLARLAKDTRSSILVRKVNDKPEPNNGLERGMLQYAQAPVDIYCATLSDPSSHQPIESRGYFVYVDSMFRWENLADFAKPDRYRSDSSRPQTKGRPAFSVAGSSAETIGSAEYPNTADGLRSFLNILLAVAKNGDRKQVIAIIQQTEIPDYRSWYSSMFIPGSAISWANPYGKYLDQREQTFAEFWQNLAKDDGEVLVRKLIDKPGGARDIEWGMLHNSRTPLDMYFASWKSATGSRYEWIGYFYYIDGMFRWDSTVSMMKVTQVDSAPHR
jgi:hypothetical protein